MVPDLSNANGRKYFVDSIIKFTKPIGSKLLLIAAAQGLLASFIAYQEMKAVTLIDMKFAELEKRNNW